MTRPTDETKQHVPDAAAPAHERVADRLLALGRDVAARVPAADHVVDHDRLLSGDDGLPR